MKSKLNYVYRTWASFKAVAILFKKVERQFQLAYNCLMQVYNK